MENPNKLSFTRKNINEDSIKLNMEDIRQEYDTKEYVSQYLFKIQYVHKYFPKTNSYQCYLSPLINNDLPICKANIPLNLQHIHKTISNYNYDRLLEDNEIYIIKEKNFRMVDQLNNGKSFYCLVIGYMINKYKDDDANTKIKKGIQEFGITENSIIKLKDGNYESFIICSHNLVKLLKIKIKSKYQNIPRDTLNYYAKILAKEAKFKQLPKNFFKE